MTRPAACPIPTDVNPALYAAIARELRRVRERVETLAETLVGDPYFVETYLEQLQAFDMIVQSTDEHAAVLDRLAQGMDVHAAIAPVRLGCVHERLRTAVARS